MLTKCPECSHEFDTDEKPFQVDWASALEPGMRAWVRELNKTLKHECHVSCFNKFFTDQILIRIDCHNETRIAEFSVDRIGDYFFIKNLVTSTFDDMHKDFLDDTPTEAS